MPSIIITAKRTSSSRRLKSASRFSRMRATNSRLTADFDVERASASTSSPTGSRVRWKRRRGDAGEHLLEHQSGERIAVG